MLILERFEGDIAVIENDNTIIETNRKNIAEDASEGDVLIEVNGRYEVDKNQTEKRRSEILKLQNSLWE